jgi:hypothetical protein
MSCTLWSPTISKLLYLHSGLPQLLKINDRASSTRNWQVKKDCTGAPMTGTLSIVMDEQSSEGWCQWEPAAEHREVVNIKIKCTLRSVSIVLIDFSDWQ